VLAGNIVGISHSLANVGSSILHLLMYNNYILGDIILA